MSQPIPQPREGSVSVGGHLWMARMIDKSRLTDDQKRILDLDYPCPMDQQLLSKLSLSGQDFQAITTQNPTDADILKALAEKGIAVQVPA